MFFIMTDRLEPWPCMRTDSQHLNMMGIIFSNLNSTHFLPVNRLEINNFSRCSNDPGEDIEQVQGRNGFKVGEDGINPDHTEDAGAHNYDKGGNNGLAKSTGGGDGTIHKGRECIGYTHNFKAVHAKFDYRRIRSK